MAKPKRPRRATLLARALVEYSITTAKNPINVATAMDRLRGLNKEALTVLRGHPKIQAIIAELKR